MFRRFESLGALAKHFENVATRLPSYEHVMLLEIGHRTAEHAKGKIGNYQPGWPPLAETTLQGFGRFPGKIQLGYAPPDNPLLRTGQMRDSIGSSVETPSVEVGARDHKAIFHELGTSRMPARPFIGPAMIERMPANIAIIGTGIATTFRTTP